MDMTMQDIARELGISIATVSRVINGHNNVSEKTKKKVLEYVEQKGYTPNAIAQNLSKKENKTIAVLVPNIGNPFFSALIDHVCKYFTEGGYQIALYNTLRDLNLEKEAVKNILQQRSAGVIAILNKGKYEDNPLDLLLQQQIPTYLLDRDLENCDLPGVFIDNYSGAYNLTKSLIERGNKRIAIITGNLEFSNARERLEGYKQAHIDFGIPFDEKNVFIGDYLYESGYIRGKEILKQDFTAIFSSNNLMLYGLLKALKEENKKLALACFEKTDIFDLLDMDLIYCNIPLDEMGKEIYQLFIDKNEKDKKYIEPIFLEKKI